MTNSSTPRSFVLVLVGLVVGLTGALTIPLAHSVTGSLSSQAASKAAPKPKSSVVACITKKRVIRGSGPKSGCPKGTKRKLVSIRGPKGKPGPGAKGIFTKIPASATTFVAVGAGISVGCRTGANHIVLGLTTATSTSRGLLIHDQGGTTDTVSWEASQLTRNSDTFVIGEFTGRRVNTAPLEHVSLAVRWLGAASSSCEVVATGVQTS